LFKSWIQRLQPLLGNQFNQGVLWNLISIGVLAVGGTIMNVLILHFRGEEALGIFNQVYALYIVASQLGVGGVQRSVLKYVAQHQDDRDLCADIIASAMLLVTMLMLPIIALVIYIAPSISALLQSPDVEQGIYYIVPGLFFFALNKPLLNTVNGLRAMRAYAVLNALRFIFIPTWILIIAAFGLPNSALALSLTVTEAILFWIMLIFLYKHLIPFRRVRNWRMWLSTHFSFGMRGILSGVLISMNKRIDVLMLGYFATDAIVGIYSFPLMITEGLSQLPIAISWNVDPVLGRYFAKNDYDKLQAFADKVKRTAFWFTTIFAILAIVLYPIGFWIFTDGDYLSASWSVFTIIMFGVTIGAWYRPFRGILIVGGLPGMESVLVFCQITINIILNMLLIPIIGIYGAAIATMFSYLVQATLLVWLARTKLGVRL